MAYEIGTKVEDYIGECINKYQNDPSVFSKATQLIAVFMARPDWPHCYDEMDEAVMQVLGDSLTSLIFGFTQRYLDDDQMEWPEGLPLNFKEELTAFHLATDPIVSQFWNGRAKPMKLFSLAQSFDRYEKTKIIRFIRMDGAYLDIEMDKNDIKNTTRMLKEFGHFEGEFEDA